MNLALDIGNTFIKAGIFDNGELVYTTKIKTNDFSPGFINNKLISGCAISSVVPSVANKVKDIIKADFNITPYLISHKSKFSLKIDYKTPETLGIDRLCGTEGAFRLFISKGNSLEVNNAIISIDFGTATTINIIHHPNIFTGGIIAPGIRMMLETLNKNTSQLPEVNLNGYEGLIGKSTNSAIASGVINSTTGLIEQTKKFLLESLNAKNVYTYITGGNAGSIIPHLNFKFEYEPDLVLKGVNSVFTMNNK
jgi:type III pantothenate kinase